MSDITTTLTSHYTLDGTLDDEIATSHLTGTVDAYEDGPVGQWVFEQSTSLLVALDDPNQDFNADTNDFTAACWLQVADATPAVLSRLMGKKAGFGAAAAGWTFTLLTTGELCVDLADGVDRVRWTGPKLAADTQYHIAFTWDASANTLVLYVNGSAVSASTSFGAPADLGNLNTGVAMGLYSDSNVVPSYDDARVYKGRALADDDIAGLVALASNTGGGGFLQRNHYFVGLGMGTGL